MAEEIVQRLRALTSKIEEFLGEGADEIIKKDKNLASAFHELLKVVPATWKKTGQNRLFSQVTKNKEYPKIQESHRKVIWGWKETHENFCSRPARDTVNLNDGSVLDGLIGAIEKDNTDLILYSVHWRISLFLMTLIKNHVCKDTNDAEEIAMCFLSNGLVSTGKFNYLKDNVLNWVKGGTKYEDLSRRLGGYGTLIYLPEIGRTNYEVHYNPTSESAYAVVGALITFIAPVAAQEFDGSNAHDVVNGIAQTTVDRIKDFRLIIIPVRYADTQQSKRTPRVKKSLFKNQAAQKRKRPNENNQDTPGSKTRRVDLRRAETGADSTANEPTSTPNQTNRTVHELSAEIEDSLDSPVSAAGDAISMVASTSADPPNFYVHQAASNVSQQATCDGSLLEQRDSASQDTSYTSSANLLDDFCLGQTPFPIAESRKIATHRFESLSEPPNHLYFHEIETVSRSDSSQVNDQQDCEEVNNIDANAAQILSQISYTSHSVNVPTHSLRGSSDHASGTLWHRPSLAAVNNSSNPLTFLPQNHSTTSNTSDDQHRNHVASEAANDSLMSQQTATSYAFQDSFPTTVHDSMMNEYSIPTTLHDSMVNEYSIPTTLHDSMMNQYSIPTTVHDSMVNEYSIPTTVHDSMVNEYSIPTTLHDSMVNQYGIPSLAITNHSNAWS